MARAYSAAGQAANVLHVIVILQVHQAKARKEMHEGDFTTARMQESSLRFSY